MKAPKAQTLIIVGIIIFLITFIIPAHSPYAVLFAGILIVIALGCLGSGMIMIVVNRRYSNRKG